MCQEDEKVLFTLNIDNYAPAITELTYPLLYSYADKIHADFHVIRQRRFPDWPCGVRLSLSPEAEATANQDALPRHPNG